MIMHTKKTVSFTDKIPGKYEHKKSKFEVTVFVVNFSTNFLQTCFELHLE